MGILVVMAQMGVKAADVSLAVKPCSSNVNVDRS